MDEAPVQSQMSHLGALVPQPAAPTPSLHCQVTSALTPAAFKETRKAGVSGWARGDGAIAAPVPEEMHLVGVLDFQISAFSSKE